MSDIDSTKILISVTRRLFIALVGSLITALVIGLLVSSVKEAEGWEHGTRIIVPGLVIVTGIIGGFVGLQRRLKDLTIADLELMANSWIYAYLSPLVGGVLALLLFVLFLSGLITGDLFPNFRPMTGSEDYLGWDCIFKHTGGYKDYMKLVFWCFVSGYSERFVTDIISRFEGAAVKTLAPGAQDTQPGTPGS